MRRKRNLRSLATFKGKKPEQQSFLNKDGTLNEKFTVNKDVAEEKPAEKPAEEQDDTE